MRQVVATLIVVMLLVWVSGAIDVHGQDACSFVGGFARLRDSVGADKVGACLEDEHFNADNGNTEQRTTGGLLVWRKADNFTAFTDGGTTWLNGPDGVQSRPNGERFSWETDPVTLANAAPSAAATPGPSSSTGFLETGTGAAATPISTIAAATPTLVTAAASPAAAASPVALAATPTKAATPTPAVTVKFTDKPDSVDTGADTTFAIETNQKKGSCALTITYNDTDPAIVAGQEFNDGKCEFKFYLTTKVKTGKAKAEASVATAAGVAKVEDDFQVKKGSVVYAGDINVELEPDDLPDDSVKLGEEVKISVKTHLDKKGTCDVSITWPKSALTPAFYGTQLHPDGDGKCAWKTTVPTDISKKSTATLIVIVRKSKDSSTLRTLTKEFDVEK